MSRLHACTISAVVGSSVLLRRDLVAELVAEWSGPVHRATEPDDLPERLVAIATPSLFASQELHVLGCSERILARNQDRLVAAAEGEPSAGRILLVLDRLLPKRAQKGQPADRLGPVLEKAGALHRLSEPDPRQLVDWLVVHMLQQAGSVERPRDVAEALLRHRGQSIDEVLQALETARVYAGEEDLAPRHVQELMDDVAISPIYEFTNAFVGGEARRCMVLLYAGQGIKPEQALAAVANELRKMLACLETDDDKDAYRRAGLKGRPGRGMYYVRKRAGGLGRLCLLRLLDGVLQANARLRRSGTDAQLVMETLVLQAQRVIRPGAGRG
ncbi:MAG: hypothetical protein ACOCXJ_09795 [Planctomycetota bacterium]